LIVPLLNHVNMRCSDLEATRLFLEQTIGVKIGPRPPIPFPGHWLYDDSGKAVIHLIESRALLGTGGAVDHVAFSIDNFSERIAELNAAGHKLQPMAVPGTQIYQVFVDGPDLIQIELQGRLTSAHYQ
jgi:catechol 2,3-dioxygenase-like lactoylglutathione lyase family enzyme